MVISFVAEFINSQFRAQGYRSVPVCLLSMDEELSAISYPSST